VRKIVEINNHITSTPGCRRLPGSAASSQFLEEAVSVAALDHGDGHIVGGHVRHEDAVLVVLQANTVLRLKYLVWSQFYDFPIYLQLQR
jgi:hypothetical protein